MIEKIVNEINGLLRDGYPYSALGVALTLPDICGNIAYPGTAVAMHYKKWYDEYVSPISAIRPDDGFMTVDGEVHAKMSPEGAVALLKEIREKEGTEA